MNRKRAGFLACILLIFSALALASPVSPSARRVIPSAFQQVVSIDYRIVQQSQAALALKAAVLPETLRSFETALKISGVDPEKDLGSLTFASFRDHSGNLKEVGIASGSFFALLKKVAQVSPKTYRGSDLFLMMRAADPKLKDIDMTFLDEATLLFGDRDALEIALNVLNGDAPSIVFDRRIADLMRDLDKAPVWSVLNRQGSLEMIRTALGDATKQPEFTGVRKGILGAQYSINFEDAVKADLTIFTLDPETSADLLSLLHKGALRQKIKGNPEALLATKDLRSEFDALGLEVHFRADKTHFQKFLQAQFFDVVCSKPDDKGGCKVSSAVGRPAEPGK